MENLIKRIGEVKKKYKEQFDSIPKEVKNVIKESTALELVALMDSK